MGVHVVSSSGVEIFSPKMLERPQILLTIADHIDYKVGVGNINNAYMYVITKDYIYTSLGFAFVKISMSLLRNHWG